MVFTGSSWRLRVGEGYPSLGSGHEAVAQSTGAARGWRADLALRPRVASNRRDGPPAPSRDRPVALAHRLHRCAAMHKQHRIPILMALAIAASSAACKGVIVSGDVLDEDTLTAVPNAIVTYTSVNTSVTYNDTSVAPSGAYLINLPEDTYIIQVVAPGCGGPPAVQRPLDSDFSPYAIDLFVDCP
jgi:hypothetical protein